MDLMDTTALRDAYRALLDAAAAVAAAGDRVSTPPEGEWNADRILAHVALVTAATVGAAASVAAGANTTYDNRLAQDTWTIDRVIELAGGTAGLRERIRCQAESLCALGGSALSGPELDTPVPTLLLSHGTVLVDAPVSLRDLVTGLAEAEIPGHTKQLLSLLPDGGGAEAAA
ncbi:hypothetical protein RMN57_04235 [Kitasatospora sp. CM 4170]|uniref:DinB-like domain-containing protein n=1 Tax=Kitasatospora aburaviensis TaxID=67265 RepID=A0ABW1EUF6_9ACTN|nr:hypothetical protein [Kitasatospora sp. CM 4170]WNM43970.1 hypothetical protein RMN57_04235 [Kitasatospora sp. CM 4170]